MLRTLVHYWRVNLAVMLGAAVAAAVLVGALLVGDSVRGSLRALTLERLGRIDYAIAGGSFFREGLAGELTDHPDFAERFSAAAPAVLLRGAMVHAGSERRASGVGIHGVDETFTAMFDEAEGLDFSRRQGQIFPSVAINQSLRRELGAEIGDAVVLSFGRFSEVPRETLLGDKDLDAVVGSLRLTVVDVLPDRGMGRFGMTPSQQDPLGAWVALRQLQRALDQPGQVNGLFVASKAQAGGDDSGVKSVDDLVADLVTLEDLGLDVETAEDHVELTSREFVLAPRMDEAVAAAARELGAPTMRVQSYLANEMRVGERVLPYSLVAALTPVEGRSWASLTAADGSPASVPSGDGILLDTWAAQDLQASIGDEVVVRYFVVGPREELTEQETRLRVTGIVAKRDLAADRGLTPEYPGMQEAEDIAAWDPPFPVDLSTIRTRDEDYWDLYGAAPKAFVAEETGRRLWSTRFGTTTSVRVGVPDGADPGSFEDRFRAALRSRLDPGAFGFAFRAVKSEGLKAASGATDFSGLFIGFSLFLIVSAALLVGLLFRLGVEQRASEIGLLLAVGHRTRKLLRGLLAEGALLAAIGAVVGAAGGVGYAALLMIGLRTIWRPAVGSSSLELHVTPVSIAIGVLCAVAVVLLSVTFAVRKLVRVAPPRLLAGSWRQPGPLRSGGASRLLGYGGLVTASGLVAYALATGQLASVGLAMGTGFLLLVSGLAFFAMWCRGGGRGVVAGGAGLMGMAARNSSWNPGRSILSVALVASACFMIVAVAANREEPGDELLGKDSGTGGYALVATSDAPLHQDLANAESRFDLGFSDRDSAALQDVGVTAFRVLPGDDASCLNLYQPGKPRLLGVGDDFIARGGFRFARTLDVPSGAVSPWELLTRPLDEADVVPAVADANSAQWILKLGLGKDLEMEDEQGRPFRVRLVGTLDRSIFQGELLIAERHFVERFPGRTGRSYFLVETDPGETAAVSRILESELGPFGFDATTTGERLAAFKVVENTYLSTFQFLGGLGLLLGTVGLGVVLVRNVIERRGELATLRAFGFRRGRLALLVLTENAFLLLTGMTIGTVAALAAVAPRLAHLNVPWTSLALTLGLVLAVGMLSSIAAVAGALRVPLLPALKSDT